MIGIGTRCLSLPEATPGREVGQHRRRADSADGRVLPQ